MPTAKKEEPQKPLMKDRPFRERFVLLQNNLHAPKSNYNSFGKYKYRSLEDICEGVKPLEEIFGIAVLTDITEYHMDAEKPWIVAIAIAQDIYSDERVTSIQPAFVDINKKGMSYEQAVGAAASYAKKYAIGGLLMIDDTKDADTNEYQEQVQKAPQKSVERAEKPKTITATEAKALESMQGMTDNLKAWILEHNKIKSFAELTPQQYASIVKQLKERAEKNEDTSETK